MATAGSGGGGSEEGGDKRSKAHPMKLFWALQVSSTDFEFEVLKTLFSIARLKASDAHSLELGAALLRVFTQSVLLILKLIPVVDPLSIHLHTQPNNSNASSAIS